MIVKKLRLQRGWSQEQLAELTDLNIRTIQRVERGKNPSLETARSLATIFEVNLTVFNSGEPSMKDSNKEVKLETKGKHDKSTILKNDEIEALKYVNGIKEFYIHLLLISVFSIVIIVKKDMTGVEVYMPMLIWSLGLILHGLMAFEWINLDRFGFFTPKWEKKMIEKRIGRKL
jgi:transcriptional regulator with XRE-family HTH domain